MGNATDFAQNDALRHKAIVKIPNWDYTLAVTRVCDARMQSQQGLLN